MSEPASLRLVRPYATVDEYLDAEAWTIDGKSMVLIGRDELEPGAVVRFEIVLDSGEKPIRAEAVVHKIVAARGARPGGARVKFRRMGAATKAMIDRATELRKTQKSLPPPPPPASEPEPVSVESSVGPRGAEPPEPSGVRHVIRAVEPPGNRDELLGRLRKRAESLAARDAASESA